MFGRTAVIFLVWACTSSTQGALGDEPTDAARAAEMKRLEGSWNITAFSFPAYEGQAMKDMSIEISSNKLTLRACPTLAGDVAAQWDTTKEPKELDIRETTAEEKPVVHRAIYKLDGEKLTIAVGRENGERPKDFDPTGTPKLLVKLERLKP